MLTLRGIGTAAAVIMVTAIGGYHAPDFFKPTDLVAVRYARIDTECTKPVNGALPAHIAVDAKNPKAGYILCPGKY
jgi:hypothetical protein